MTVNSDFKDLLRCLNGENVRYLIIGGYAVMVYTEPRFTKDLDIWIAPVLENGAAVLRALAVFGAPPTAVTAQDLMDPEIIYQVGVDPVRIDIISDIPGLEFEPAWERRTEVRFDEVPAFVISRDDLITAKRASGRKRDKADARKLAKRRER